jgi:hypothetical protein
MLQADVEAICAPFSIPQELVPADVLTTHIERHAVRRILGSALCGTPRNGCKWWRQHLQALRISSRCWAGFGVGIQTRAVREFGRQLRHWRRGGRWRSGGRRRNLVRQLQRNVANRIFQNGGVAGARKRDLRKCLHTRRVALRQSRIRLEVAAKRRVVVAIPIIGEADSSRKY